MSSPSFIPKETAYKLTTKNYRGRTIHLEPTPSNLTDAFWTRTLIVNIVNYSNDYVAARKQQDPDYWMWSRHLSSKPFTISCVYQFIAMLYYFGICRMPSKRDYWSNDQYMPQHAICKELGMTRDRFDFLWRHFKVSPTTADDLANNTSDTKESQGTDVDDDDLVGVTDGEGGQRTTGGRERE